MIKIRTRIHDKFSLEFKLWLMETLARGSKSLKNNSFILESWSFIPGSLDINTVTYSRETFYADIKSYYRTITPVYRLSEMYRNKFGMPFSFLYMAAENLSNSMPNYSKFDIKEFDYQIKMFSAIFKSALRESYNEYKINKGCTVKLLADQLVVEFVQQMKSVIESYISISEKIKNTLPDNLYTNYIFGLEFCINLMQFYLYKILDSSPNKQSEYTVKEALLWVADTKKEFDLGQIEKDKLEINSKLLYKWAILKKFVESDLFLSIDKKKSGMLTEQFYYSIAAGLSMVFATVMSFTFQQRYGNFTLPFFVALVISYMFKDRIKELCRYAFAKNRKINYFDHKIKLSVKDENIGVAREGVDFIPYDKVPQVILEQRQEKSIVAIDKTLKQDSVLFYRTKVEYNPQKLSGTQYKISGLNQILVVNLSSFIKKMDDPTTTLRSPALEKVVVDRVYYITTIVRLTSKADGESFLKHYRVALNRDGIKHLEEL